MMDVAGHNDNGLDTKPEDHEASIEDQKSDVIVDKQVTVQTHDEPSHVESKNTQSERDDNESQQTNETSVIKDQSYVDCTSVSPPSPIPEPSAPTMEMLGDNSEPKQCVSDDKNIELDDNETKHNCETTIAAPVTDAADVKKDQVHRVDKVEEADHNIVAADAEETDIVKETVEAKETETTEDVEHQVNDGETEKTSDGEAQKTTLDLDEDKKNPQYIPKKGMFYEHDDRLSGEPVPEDVDPAPKKADEDDQQRKESKERKNTSTERQRNQRRPNRRNVRSENNRWGHDRFSHDEQKPKSTAELTRAYGYDIRNEHKNQDKLGETGSEEQPNKSSSVEATGGKAVDSPRRNQMPSGGARGDNRSGGNQRGMQREFRPNNSERRTNNSDRSDKPPMRRVGDRSGPQERRDRPRNPRSGERNVGAKSEHQNEKSDDKLGQLISDQQKSPRQNTAADSQSGSLRNDTRRFPFDNNKSQDRSSGQMNRNDRSFNNRQNSGGRDQTSNPQSGNGRAPNADRVQRHDNRSKTFMPRDRPVSREKLSASTNDKSVASDSAVDGGAKVSKVETKFPGAGESPSNQNRSQRTIPQSGGAQLGKPQQQHLGGRPSEISTYRDRDNKSGQPSNIRQMGQHQPDHYVGGPRKNYGSRDDPNSSMSTRTFHQHGDYKAHFSYQGDHHNHQQHQHQSFSRNNSSNNKSYGNNSQASYNSTSNSMEGNFDMEPIKTQTFENSRLTNSSNNSNTSNSINNSINSRANFRDNRDGREIINEKRRQQQSMLSGQSNFTNYHPNSMSSARPDSDTVDISFNASSNMMSNHQNQPGHHQQQQQHGGRPITKSSEIYTRDFFARRGMDIGSDIGGSVSSGNTQNLNESRTSPDKTSISPGGKTSGNVHQLMSDLEGLSLDNHSAFVGGDTNSVGNTSIASSTATTSTTSKQVLAGSHKPLEQLHHHHHHHHQQQQQHQQPQHHHQHQHHQQISNDLHHHHHQVTPPLSTTANSIVSTQATTHHPHHHHRGMVTDNNGAIMEHPYYGTPPSGARDSVSIAALAAYHHGYMPHAALPVDTNRYMTSAHGPMSSHSFMPSAAGQGPPPDLYASGGAHPNDGRFLTAAGAALSPSGMPVTGAGPPPPNVLASHPAPPYMQHHQFPAAPPPPSAYANHHYSTAQVPPPQAGPATPNHAYTSAGFAIPSAATAAAVAVSNGAETGTDIYAMQPPNSIAYYDQHPQRTLPPQRRHKPIPIVNPSSMSHYDMSSDHYPTYVDPMD